VSSPEKAHSLISLGFSSNSCFFPNGINIHWIFRKQYFCPKNTQEAESFYLILKISNRGCLTGSVSVEHATLNLRVCEFKPHVGHGDYLKLK